MAAIEHERILRLMERAVRVGAVLAVAVSVGFASGCSARADGSTPEAGEGVSVVVENHHWSDVTVYRLQGAARVRLGMVPSMSRRAFDLGARLNPARRLWLEAEPVGSTVVERTGSLQVEPGNEIHWALENDLALSICTVR